MNTTHTAAEIAAACGVSPQTVSLWKRGITHPTRATAVKLAAMLGGEPEDYQRTPMRDRYVLYTLESLRYFLAHRRGAIVAEGRVATDELERMMVRIDKSIDMMRRKES